LPGDVEFDRSPPHPHFWQPGKGTLNALPLPDGVFRIFGVEAARTGLDPRTVRLRREEPLDTEALRTSMLRITGDDWGPRTMRRGSRNTDTARHAEHNRVDGCSSSEMPRTSTCLSAAKDSTPAPRTRPTSSGSSPPRSRAGRRSIYAPDRTATRPNVARRPPANTLAQDAASMNFTAANAALRDLLGELIDQRGDTAATLVGWLSALEAHYPAPAGAAHPLGGHRVPDLMTERGRLHSLLAPRHLLVGLDGRAVDAHHGPAAPHRHGPCSTPSCRRKFALQGNGRQRSHAEHDEGRGDVDPQITRTPEGAVRLADGVG
jgi:hypothetical protein